MSDRTASQGNRGTPSELMSRDFRSAYEEHVWDVYGFLAYRASSREEAEDLTQLTFERALGAWARFDPTRASVKTWLLAIARNALVDQHRRGRTRHERSLEEAELADAVQLQAAGPEDALVGVGPELSDAIRRLGVTEREVLALRFGADMVSTEIAAVLDLSVSNVYQITSRALRKLRAELDARAGREPAASPPPVRRLRA